MKILEDNKVYRLDHNGKISAAFLETRDEYNKLVFAIHKNSNVAGYDEVETENGLRFEAGDSYLEFSPLTLEAASEVFPNTIRVFNDLQVFETYVKRAILMADSYTENTEPEEVISFTVDDQDNVLELIKVTKDGDMFYWVGDDWTEVGEDDDIPTIFDKEVIDVERDDIGKALELWQNAKTSGRAVHKEEILPLAALDQ